MFYVMLALRAELRRRGVFDAKPEPNLAHLLDLVALGTVADVVQLDPNNRDPGGQGLRRIRAGQACSRASRRCFARRRARPAARRRFDLGFALGPRLNAAGRLADMALGIECLATDDPARAPSIARQLDRLNRERREIEAGMQDAALERSCSGIAVGDSYSLALYRPGLAPGRDRHPRRRASRIATIAP